MSDALFFAIIATGTFLATCGIAIATILPGNALTPEAFPLHADQMDTLTGDWLV